MKGLLTIISVLIIFLQFGVTACTKENTIIDTVTVNIHDTLTVVKKDTLIIKDTAISLQLLTANPWKTYYFRGVKGNVITYYQRGGTGNTENYDNEYIKFNADKSGILFDAAGSTHAITWDFANTEKSKLTFVVQNPFPLANQSVAWENLRYKNASLLYDQYWTYNSVNSHINAVRIPR